jgi:hypothetical protein
MQDEAPPPKLTIDPALEWQGKTWDELTFRRPTYAEFLEAKKGELYLTTVCTGVPVQALLKADAALLLEAGEVISGFLAARQLRRGES